MTAPRRRVLRPVRAISADPQRSAQHQARLSRLEQERKGFDRWLTRLKRACSAVEKHQGRIARLERQLSQDG
jgi:hypothetical protein